MCNWKVAVMNNNQNPHRHFLNKVSLRSKAFYILLAVIACMYSTLTHSQTGLLNLGELRIHQGGAIGFHTNFINNSPFSENRGLAGFYGESSVTLSGAFIPEFHDLEVVTPGGLEIQTSVVINGLLNFILGDIRTPPSLESIHLNFAEAGDYTGAADTGKVHGISAVQLRMGFRFPVGDQLQLRPLVLNSEYANAVAKCTYFFADAGKPGPSRIYLPFLKSPLIAGVSKREFWKLEASVVSTITVDWNRRSQLEELTMDLNEIILAGWSKAEARWVPLGREKIYGNIYSGRIQSAPFVPSDYEAITFASLHMPKGLSAGTNYFLSPNNDGINDLLQFPELPTESRKMLKIYDRNGIKVFEKENYTNEFDGRASTGKLLINPGGLLPEGVYFYLLSLPDGGLNYQGFLYLER